MIFRKTIPIIVCFFLYTSISAQPFNIDSLERVLTAFRGDNLEKGNLLVDLFNAYSFAGDTAKSRAYATEALNLAQKYGLETVEKRAHSALANYHLLSDRYYLAHSHFKKTEKLCLKHNDMVYLTRIYLNLMVLFARLDDLNSVLLYADKFIETTAQWYDQTTFTPYDTLHLQQAGIMPTWIFYVQTAKGEAMIRLYDNQEDVLDYFVGMFQESMLLNVDIPETKIQIAVLCGKILNELNRPDESLYYLNLANDMYEAGIKYHIPTTISALYAVYAKAYAMLNQTDSAEYFMKKTEEFPIIDDQIRIFHYQARIAIENAKGNYRSAYEMYQKYHHFTDSIAKEGKSIEITRLKNWYELEQKDHENEILIQEKQKQQKLILILAVALALIIALFALSIILYRKTAEKNTELKKLHAVKDKLFSVVAHDLRRPMGALISILKLANKDMLDAETQAQLLKDITSRVDETYGLLENLLRWAKSQMQGIIPTPVHFNAQDASRTVTDAIQYIASSKGIILNNNIKEQQVFADPDMFAAIVRNMTMNAVKYSSAVGEVNLYSELTDNKLVISVKDNGTGIPKEIQDNLFDISKTQSRRGTNNESGTGLGLVLCADFVKMNGGSIWFTSKEGEGSTFSFTVPVKELRIEN